MASRRATRKSGFGVRPRLVVLLALLTLGVASASARAQPFGQFLLLSGPAEGHVSVPSTPDLNPSAAFTFEAWVKVTDPGGCSNIAGKNYQQSWWIGICGTTLRSYLKGGIGSQRNGGVLTPGEWSHIAVVYDGAHRFHYINGEQVASFAETGPLPASSSDLQIGGDAAYANHTPNGTIDDVRLWNIARTQTQIRAALAYLESPTPTGLVARWLFDGNTNDSIGGHNGTRVGTTAYGFFGTGASCDAAANSTSLCLFHRVLIRAKFRVGAQGTSEGIAQVVPVSNPGSGLFWFFSSDNWEVMVKAINACSLNSRWWIFSAATTNVYYRLEVFDYPTGTQRIYFNYPGPPAPAVTDVSALATCP